MAPFVPPLFKGGGQEGGKMLNSLLAIKIQPPSPPSPCQGEGVNSL